MQEGLSAKSLLGGHWNEALREAIARAVSGVAPSEHADASAPAPPCAITGLGRLSGGASLETWRFDLVEGATTTPLILRRIPVNAVGGVRDGACIDMPTEAALLGLAAHAHVPVPRVCAVLEPAHGLGEGFVMERIDGETLGRKIVHSPELASARLLLAHQCGVALARIHQIARAKLPRLREAAAQTQLEHYRSQHRRHGTTRPVFELAFRWLAENAPATPMQPVLVHGDFRNGNLIVDATGLRSVLDWELAHLGDGMEDLGWICVNSWRFGAHDLPVGGFGTREALFTGYEQAGGRVDVASMHYWQVFGTLKWGVICEGMAHAYLGGTERNLEKAAIGRRASETEIDLLELLAPQQRSRLAVQHAAPVPGA